MCAHADFRLGLVDDALGHRDDALGVDGVGPEAVAEDVDVALGGGHVVRERRQDRVVLEEEPARRDLSGGRSCGGSQVGREGAEAARHGR